MKRSLLTATILLSVGWANAQNSQTTTSKVAEFTLAGNVGVGATSGYKITFGGDAHVGYGIGLRTKATGSLGYQQFRYEFRSAFANGALNFGAVPILAGIKYDLHSIIYAEGMLGYAIWTGDGPTGTGHFAYLARVGSKVRALDVAFQFMSISDADVLSLRVGVGLGGSKK